MTPDPPLPPDEPRPDVPSEAPFESERPEDEHPRRAASAQFAVDAEVGSAAAIREAMDPANQSLADALRLSFRVLQIVILVLVVLFLFSGLKLVESGQTGVKLWFGAISGADEGEQALAPGLRWTILPYPAGEFVLFKDQNRFVDVANAFYPRLGAGRTEESAIERAQAYQQLDPVNAGTLVTRDGDLVHVQLVARYKVDRPVRYVEAFESDEQADRVVALVLQRAAVRTATKFTLQEMLELTDVVRADVADGMQSMLDGLGCGLTIVEVNVPSTSPPFAIAKEYTTLQEITEQARERITAAELEASNTLLGVAGAAYDDLVALIERYEDELTANETAAADATLREINAVLVSDDVQGEVAEIVKRAQAYSSEVDRTLGNEARKFAGLLSTYRTAPRFTKLEQLEDVLASVFAQRDVEVFWVPPGATFDLRLESLNELQEERRDLRIERQERDARAASASPLGYIRQLEDVKDPNRAGRRLRVEEGRIRTGADE